MQWIFNLFLYIRPHIRGLNLNPSDYLGKFTYLNILTVHLDDFTERGVQWKTWQNLGEYFLFKGSFSY